MSCYQPLIVVIALHKKRRAICDITRMPPQRNAICSGTVIAKQKRRRLLLAFDGKHPNGQLSSFAI
jgi:hypothetical protein